MKKFEYKIPNGYVIRSFERVLDAITAEKWLTSKRQRRFATATRLENGRIKLTGHRVVCPHCRTFTPAYARNLVERHVRLHLPGRKPQRFVKNWIESGAPEIFFNKPTRPDLLGTFRCGACGFTSEPKSREELVEIETEEGKILLRTTTPGISSLCLHPFS